MYLETHESPTQFRYIEWVLTVPMLCAQFYLLMSPAGAKTGLLWVLAVGAVWMISFGYAGEISGPERSIIWGSISTLGYFAVVYEVWFGRLGKKLTNMRARAPMTTPRLYPSASFRWKRPWNTSRRMSTWK